MENYKANITTYLKELSATIIKMQACIRQQRGIVEESVLDARTLANMYCEPFDMDGGTPFHGYILSYFDYVDMFVWVQTILNC